MKHIANEDIARCVNLPVLIEELEDAYRGDLYRRSITPIRILIAADEPFRLFGVMPSVSDSLGLFVSKVAAFTDKPIRPGVDRVQALVVAFDTQSGSPIATLDGAGVTMMKCAAVTGFVTKTCTPETASSIGILGCGVLAEAQIRGVAAVRSVQHVAIFGRTKLRSERFGSLVRQLIGPNAQIDLTGEIAETVMDKQVICTATSSRTPLIENAELLPNAHINCMGAHDINMSEVSAAIFKQCLVLVEDIETAVKEGGDIHADALDLEAMVRMPPPSLREVRTLFSSTGHGFLDLVTTAHILRRAQD